MVIELEFNLESFLQKFHKHWDTKACRKVPLASASFDMKNIEQLKLI